MSDIEDNARNLTWWWNQLDLSKDWNSLPKGMRDDLLKKLNRVFIEIAEFNISKKELLDLIILTDPPTVWDAMLSLRGLPNIKRKNHWEVLAYLNKIVINTWKQKHPLVKPTWQPAPVAQKPIKVASDKIVKMWNPLDFKRRRCGCGSLLRSDNNTGLCRTCQRQRNGK